jgi:ClpX C4-type zinc finger
MDMKGVMGIKRLATRMLGAPRLRCAFCGRDADSVGRLVAGASAHICDQCITKCVAVLEQHGGLPPPAPTGTAPGR